MNASESLAPLGFHDVAGSRFHARSVAGTVIATFPEESEAVDHAISHAAKTLMCYVKTTQTLELYSMTVALSHIHYKEKEAGK